MYEIWAVCDDGKAARMSLKVKLNNNISFQWFADELGWHRGLIKSVSTCNIIFRRKYF